MAEINGYFAVIVYHNNSGVKVEDIIPCTDSVFKNIKIPILLITMEDGNKLKAYLQNYNIVELELIVDLPGKETEIVTVEFWLNPLSIESYSVITNMKERFEQFDHSIILRPKYKFKSLKKDY